MAASPKVTDFQRRVYKATCRIPVGSVTTYREIAREIGCQSAQAIGQALRCNPFAPKVPCHRVIKSDFRLGGFSGQSSGEWIDKKRALLKQEGVLFDSQGRLCDPERLFHFPK